MSVDSITRFPNQRLGIRVLLQLLYDGRNLIGGQVRDDGRCGGVYLLAEPAEVEEMEAALKESGTYTGTIGE